MGRRVQAVVDERVASSEPADQVAILPIIDRNVEMSVSCDQLLIVRK